MEKSGKLKIKETVAGDLKRAHSLIIAEYRGLTVAEVTALRVELKKADSKFKVAKNRIVIKAIEQDVPDMGCVKGRLKGPVGVVCVFGDTVQAAKTALNFQKDHPKFIVTGGYMEKAQLSVDQLKEISDLPSKEVLLGRLVGSLLAPHRGLVTTLSGVSRMLVQVIGAIKDKKAEN